MQISLLGSVDSLGTDTHKEPDEGMMEVNRVLEDNSAVNGLELSHSFYKSSRKYWEKGCQRKCVDYFIEGFEFQIKELFVWIV